MRTPPPRTYTARPHLFVAALAALAVSAAACGSAPGPADADSGCDACEAATDVPTDVGTECNDNTVPVHCRATSDGRVCSADTGNVAACVSGRWVCSSSGEIPSSRCWCSTGDVARGCTCTMSGPVCPDAGAVDAQRPDTMFIDDVPMSTDGAPPADATLDDAPASTDASSADAAIDGSAG